MVLMKHLSVAVPCYNVEKYLHKCLDSFSDDRLRQDLEVLIIDDGSTDSTAEIAREYVERYPDIFRLIQKENGGHGSAVNAGIANATGRYFRIVDGDDWVHTDNLIALIGLLKDTETDLVVDQKTKVDMTTEKKAFYRCRPVLCLTTNTPFGCQQRRDMPLLRPSHPERQAAAPEGE